MKAFFYIKSIAAGGAETQSTIIASGLKRECGIEVEFIVYSLRGADAKNLARLTEAGIRIRELYWKRPGDLCKMFRLFRANRDGALFSFTSFPNMIGGCLARLAGMRKVFAGIRSDRLPKGHFQIEKFLNRFVVAYTVFNSYRGRERFVAQGFNPKKCAVVSNAVEPTALVKVFDGGDVPNGLRVITVGRFTPDKDYRTFLETVALVRKSQGNVQAMIIGYGAQESEIRNWIGEMKLEDVVRILPGNKGVNIPEELSKADVYISTSIREGCSNSVLEAMRAGLPIVATDVGDNAHMVREGANGYVCEVGDAQSLAAAVLLLYGDALLRARYGKAAMQIVADEYSERAVFEKYRELAGA